jgi:HSP20 family protein
MKSLMKGQTHDQGSQLFDPIFEDFFSVPSLFAGSDSDFVPRVDIRDSKDHLTLSFEVPGMKKEDFKVSVKDTVLSISGNRVVREEKTDDTFLRREILTGSFCRQFTLPPTVRVDNIDAEYRNGVLTVSLAKFEEAKPKEIEIKIS